MATLHFQKPGGTEYPTKQQGIDAIGHFETTYAAPYDRPIGSYTWWAIDGPTGQSSNSVIYAIIGNVDLGDAILALKVMAGIESPANIHAEADINSDGKIGLAEVVYILQKTAGLR